MLERMLRAREGRGRDSEGREGKKRREKRGEKRGGERGGERGEKRRNR